MKRKLIGMLLIACCFGLLLTGCTDTPKEYNISVLINGAIHGTVDDISGSYSEGSRVTVKANPKDGETFFCWLHDGQVVSKDASYTFVVNEKNSGTYLALFKSADLEYICLESFDFTNVVSELDTDTEELSLTEIAISFGYYQSNFYEVYSCTGDSLPTTDSTTVAFETIYENNLFPFAFDKTRDIYIKIITKYTKISEDAENSYQSETIVKLDKTAIGKQVANKEDVQLNQNKNVTDSNIKLEENDSHNKITINFKNLSEFTFDEETEE